MHLNKRTGILLLNLGTPGSCEVTDVRAYLRQFLNDPRVIELPNPWRWLLVNGWIVPFRAKKSAAAYAKIWQPEGSPLLINSILLKQNLQRKLGSDYIISLGMTYGNPSIKSAISELLDAKVHKILVMPLFPQYASSSSGAALEQMFNILAKVKVIPSIEVKPEFYQESNFIEALSVSIKPYLKTDFDFLLMSYHGLPERQMQHQTCDLNQPCPGITKQNQNCYRAQCYQTSRLLAKNLNLADNKWGVSFQSRLGRLPWIKPYTDQYLIELRERNVKNLVVCCPSFVADCLETLEEIGIRAAEQWHSLGGESLKLVPALNAQDKWIESLAKILITNEVNSADIKKIHIDKELSTSSDLDLIDHSFSLTENL